MRKPGLYSAANLRFACDGIFRILEVCQEALRLRTAPLTSSHLISALWTARKPAPNSVVDRTHAGSTRGGSKIIVVGRRLDAGWQGRKYFVVGIRSCQVGRLQGSKPREQRQGQGLRYNTAGNLYYIYKVQVCTGRHGFTLCPQCRRKRSTARLGGGKEVLLLRSQVCIDHPLCTSSALRAAAASGKDDLSAHKSATCLPYSSMEASWARAWQTIVMTCRYGFPALYTIVSAPENPGPRSSRSQLSTSSSSPVLQTSHQLRRTTNQPEKCSQM